MGYRKRGESWEVNVFRNGIRRFATAATEEQAKDLEVEMRAELIRAERGPDPIVTQPVLPSIPSVTSWTLGRAITVAFDTKWTGTKSEKFYTRLTANLVKHFGADTMLSAIDTSAVDNLRSTLRTKGNNKYKQGNSQATINHHLATLSMLFKVAHERGGVAMKPVMGIKQAYRARARFVSEAEERIMLSLLTQWEKPDMRDWFEILIDTGMRPTETRDMTGAWCDFRQGHIHVYISKTRSGIRNIPMTKRVHAILERRCLEHPRGPIFPYKWDRFQNVWDALQKALGLDDDRDFVAYSLRHTFGTRLIQRGERVEVIKDLMGHASIQQTMQYAHLGSSQYVSAIAKLEPQT